MKSVNTARFEKAKPVWEKGMETQMNRHLVFRAVVEKAPNTVLRLSGHTCYSVFVNGLFVAVGPARAGHGYYRVDELPVTPYLREGKNVISVTVAGYNCNSYCFIDMPSFLCAEVAQDNAVTAFTSGNQKDKSASGDQYFEACVQSGRISKVQRYSFQRPFTEAYDYDRDYNSYHIDPCYKGNAVELSEVSEKKFIKRGSYYPEYEHEAAKSIVIRGEITVDPTIKKEPPRGTNGIGAGFKGFSKEELAVFSTDEADKLCFTPISQTIKKAKNITLASNAYGIYDMEKDLTGLIKMTVSCLEDTTVYLLFDELLVNGRIDYKRLDCANVVVYRLKAGTTYHLLSFEPYTFKYLCVASAGGGITVSDVGLIRVDFPKSAIIKKLAVKDEQLKKIYDAALESFRQNTFDIYMDCPSRERAGWLCDSFFISRVEYALTGQSRVDRNFLSNFLMPEKFEFLPDGMLPMCYPADHNDGVFIPNWAMWFILQLAEYWERSGDGTLIKDAMGRVYGLIEYFRKFENADGLLENLESWIFVEWSEANQHTQNVNYPTNMLYCLLKKTVGNLYGDGRLIEEAERLKTVIREKSKGDLFYCDNSVYDEKGDLQLSGFCSEVCQYYAFFTGVADKDNEDKALWQVLLSDFGPDRKRNNKRPEIAMANAFIGNYLRLELLYRYGYYDLLIENIKGYFYHMAESTGTLWEHDNQSASCCHGFASHVIYWLEKLGYVK